MSAFTESVVEDAALAWLEGLGYAIKNGLEIAPGEFGAERADYSQVILEDRLRQALVRLNTELPPEALDDAFRRLTRPDGANLDARNRAVHRWLVDGVTVEYRRKDGSIAGAQAQVSNFDNPDNNDWLAVNQFTVAENKHNRRPDVVLFVNGIPLAVLELKNAADENATIWTAFQQLQTYQHEIPSLFTYNAAVVVSDGLESRIGALGAGKEWFKPWRTISGESLADPFIPELQVTIEGVFEKRRFLDMLITSSCSRTRATGGSSRKWPVITSFMQSMLPLKKPCAPRCVRGRPKGKGVTRQVESPAVNPGTGGSAWSGILKGQGRA